jgi:hypothetical protein
MNNVTVSGPLFDARAEHYVREFCTEALDQVAGQASANVHTNLDASIRHPTPYYETQIHTVKVDADTRSVNDRKIIYGPWLEGTGSRNSPVTRFPGYHSFSRARTLLESQIPRLIERARRRLEERLNGR